MNINSKQMKVQVVIITHLLFSLAPNNIFTEYEMVTETILINNWSSVMGDAEEDDGDDDVFKLNRLPVIRNRKWMG